MLSLFSIAKQQRKPGTLSGEASSSAEGDLSGLQQQQQQKQQEGRGGGGGVSGKDLPVSQGPNQSFQGGLEGTSGHNSGGITSSILTWNSEWQHPSTRRASEETRGGAGESNTHRRPSSVSFCIICQIRPGMAYSPLLKPLTHACASIRAGLNALSRFPFAKHVPGQECECCAQPQIMQQTLEELDFERGIWWAAASGDIQRMQELGAFLLPTVPRRIVDSKGGMHVGPFPPPQPRPRGSPANTLGESSSPCTRASRNPDRLTLPRLAAVEKKQRDVNERDLGGYCALHYAARGGHATACKVLLDYGAEVDARTSEGKATPLMRACTAGHGDCARLLISRRACVSACDSEGQTPLHKAADAGQAEVVRYLLGVPVSATFSLAALLARGSHLLCCVVAYPQGLVAGACDSLGRRPADLTSDAGIVTMLHPAGEDRCGGAGSTGMEARSCE